MLKIITDSSANITQAEAKQMGVEVLPLGIIFGDEEYLDGIDINEEQFYEKLITAKSNYPHTSMLNMDLIEKTFKAAKDNNDTVLLITISSKLSGTYNCANLVKNNGNYNNVYVYDSLGATTKVRLLVDTAVKHKNKPIEEIIKILDDVRSRITLFAGIQTLDYLRKGGRLSKGGAIVGNLLSIKPIITISKEGEIHVVEKAIGVNHAIKQVKKLSSNYEFDPEHKIYFIYSHTQENCEKLKALYSEDVINNSTTCNLAAVIGCHIGTGVAGICFVEKKK